MRFTPRWVLGNIAWFPTGAPWAMWRVAPETMTYLPDDRQAEILDTARAALLELPGEAMILSVQPEEDPVGVHDRMIGDVDTQAHPAWEENALEVFAHLSDNPAYTRVFYVAVELAKVSKGGAFRSSPIGEPSAEERDYAQADARSFYLALGASLDLTPVTQAEMEWVYERAFRRGAAEPPMRVGEPEPEGELQALEAQEASERGSSLEEMDRAILKEGGDSYDLELRREGWKRFLPHRPRRYLKLTTVETVSFQSFLVLHRTPWFFTPAELLRCDLQRFPVDWCIRIRSIENARALDAVKRKLEHLTQQGSEREAEIRATGEMPGDLARAIITTQEFRDHLAATNDPEHRACVIFCVYGPTAQDAEERAADLRRAYAPIDWRLQRPTGGQLPLFTASLPGTLRRQAAMLMADYRQHFFPDDLSKLGLFLGLDLGDRSGTLFGYSATAKHTRLVLINPAEAQRIGRSGSAMFVGASGEGKSVTGKMLATSVIDQGGMVTAIDVTDQQEWVRWLAVQDLPEERKALVDLTESPTLSLDPLRVFAHDPGAGRRYALGLAVMIAGCDHRGDEGTSIKEAIDQAADSPEPSMPLALEILEDMARRDVAGAALALRHLNTFARRPKSGEWLGALIFDRTRRVLDLRNIDALIFGAAKLSLPTREQMLSPDLSRNLLPEQHFAVAILYAVAAVQQVFTLLDRNRFGVAVLDEAHTYMATIDGRALIEGGVRKGRKENAAVWILTQHPADTPPELAAQFEYRFIFGQARNAGNEAAILIGLEPTDDLRILLEEKMRRKDLDLNAPPAPALCLLRDTLGRVGLVWVRPPQGKHAIAYETNPARMRQLEEVPA